jgi:diphthamide synthase subunit DPH2
MRKIVIASSAKFYNEVLELKKELENKGYNVIDHPRKINVNIEEDHIWL